MRRISTRFSRIKQQPPRRKRAYYNWAHWGWEYKQVFAKEDFAHYQSWTGAQLDEQYLNWWKTFDGGRMARATAEPIVVKRLRHMPRFQKVGELICQQQAILFSQLNSSSNSS